MSMFTFLAISLIQATPFSNSVNTKDPYFLHSAKGRILNITSVITPNVPKMQPHTSNKHNIEKHFETDRANYKSYQNEEEMIFS